VSASAEVVPKMETAFPLCTAIESRCFKKAVALDSPDTALILLPNSLMKANPDGPHVPKVSMAIGTKSWATARGAYLVDLTPSADVAADPARMADRWTCEGAEVSGVVASQSRQRPRVRGTRVAPSGLLESILVRPGVHALKEFWHFVELGG